MYVENQCKIAIGFLFYLNFIENIAPSNNYISVNEGSGIAQLNDRRIRVRFPTRT